MNYQTLTAEELLNHQEHFINFAKNDVEYFKFIPAKLRNQKEFILNFIGFFDENKETYPIKYVSSYCKEIMQSSLVFEDDKEIVLKLTEKSSDCIANASERLRADKEIALAALRASSRDSPGDQHYFSHFTFRHFSEDLKEKLYKTTCYSEAIKYLEAELLYEKLQSDLQENQTINKRIKI